MADKRSVHLRLTLDEASHLVAASALLANEYNRRDPEPEYGPAGRQRLIDAINREKRRVE